MADSRDSDMVFRQLSKDMRNGLKNIYQQISTVSTDKDSSSRATEALFMEASDQLAEVVRTTESATMHIMEIVEKQLERRAECAQILEKLKTSPENEGDLARLEKFNSDLDEDLTSVLTSLSFQDLTGQRIKKVVEALNAIEKIVVELYVSSGLIMEAAEKDPEKDAEELRAAARQAVEDFRETRKGASELKGPDKNGVSQSAIDDMLAQLGL